MRLEPVDPGAIRDEWTELAAGSGNIFATPEFLELWWEHFGAGYELRLVAGRDGAGVLRALYPLYLLRRRPVRVVRLVGHGAGDQLGPIAAPDDRAEARAALMSALRERAALMVFIGAQLPGDEPWAEALGGRTLRREGSPVLSLAGESWETLLASWSSKLRRDLRVDERKLGEHHGLVFRLADDPARLESDLDTLFALHRARWAGSEFAARESFHRAFAREAARKGWLRLWLLELEGKPAAAWYGFRFQNVESHYQVGRDPAWQKWGIGTLLSGHTIREALADGMEEYRFLRGDEAYKYRFARTDPGLVTVASTRPRSGVLAFAAADAVRRVTKRR